MNSRNDAADLQRPASTGAIADVLVVGGGIVGAAAALGAAHAGLSTTWVVGSEASDARPQGHDADRDLRVYALGPGTQRFLERLRVWQQLDASRLAPVFDMRVYGAATGRAALHFGAYEAAVEKLATIVEHRELSRVLQSAAQFFPGIERIDGMATQVAIDADRATVSTDRGLRSGRLLIAADGAGSPVRDSIGIDVSSRPYGQRALVGNFACAGPHGGAAHQWFTAEGVVALLPLAGGGDVEHAMSLVWSAPDAVADTLIADGPAGIARRLSALVAQRQGLDLGPLTALGAVVAIPLSLLTARRMIGARTALVGDAAHVVHPLAGQGLNLGLGDVDTLLDFVIDRESFRDPGDLVVLRRYERARAAPVLAVRQVTDGLSRLFDSERRDVAAAREIGMRLLDRIAPLKRLLVRQASGGP